MRPHVVGVGFGGHLAMELYRRHPKLAQSLVLSTAFPGWADSLPAEVVAQRLQWCRRETELLDEPFVRGWTLGLRMEQATAPVADELAASTSDVPPPGFRVLARSTPSGEPRPQGGEVQPAVEAKTNELTVEHDPMAGERLGGGESSGNAPRDAATPARPQAPVVAIDDQLAATPIPFEFEHPRSPFG